jgi:hypothetical protein
MYIIVQCTYVYNLSSTPPIMVKKRKIIFVTIITKFNKRRLHRPGIEPGPPAWQASILPLNQRCCHVKCDEFIECKLL